MDIQYFHDTDTLSIILNNHEIVETKDVNGNVICDFDQSGQVVSITIEHAKQVTHLNQLIKSIPHDDNHLAEKIQKANKKLLHISDQLKDITKTKQNFSLTSPISQFGERLINAFGHHMLASGGSLYMVESNGLRLVHALDPGHAPEFIPFPLKDNSVLEYLLTTGKPLLIHDLKDASRFSSSGWDGYLDDSVMAFPIPDENDRIVGLLSFHSRVPPQFEEHDKELGILLTHFTSETLRAIKATYALHESQERLRLIMEATNDGIWDWNPITNVIYYSPRWFTLLGYEPDAFPHTYETFQNLLHSDDRIRLDHFFCNQLENKKAFSIAFRMKTADSNWLWVESRGKAMEWDDSGKTTRVMGTLSDISERKYSEIELYRHSQALQQSLDGIIIADMSGKIEFVNDAWARMHGYRTTELNGKNLYIFMPAPQQTNFSKFIQEVESHQGGIQEKEHLCKDGKTFFIRLSVSILKKATGHVIGLILIARDITDERNLEAQLLQAQKMESIGRMAGGIAHDFNNLLSPILANTQMVLTDPLLKTSHKQKLERVLTATERASVLTRQILAFSRKQPLALQTFCLAEVVDGFYRIMSSIIREDIEFSIDTSQSKGYIHADISHIEQILMNIIVNAQDAMSQGGTLNLFVSDIALDDEYTEKHPEVTPGPYVMIVVSDTGIGMSSEVLKQAFEPFYTTKEKGKGTGLGLSTVYGIVKQHDGHIRVFSSENKGTTFTFYFPRVEKVDKKVPKIYPPQQQTGGHETILVVEDEDMVRDLVCSILKRLGYHVLDAQNASQCFNLIASYDGPIHLLISDVVMPGMNGKELYLNLSKQYPDMKVLFMSGYTDDVILDRGIENSAQKFLQKPISVQKMAETVKRILNNE
ncbi:MAG: PAS/PAC sensor hybrid histidine kinase [Candidatus Magnetoglobus multicellularis str. Araruama]|uniref:histidine kinase n=1 Tax=Candidatus Magnetoglobus multicellularis str. Araruama TaxID=890399 RepID=A0A1V1PCH8_9BACT|nr:MAG: PAS/PAC sensor hybrid histidine kinase [Candidatus Magnetoglobus multicellularis str. Araruama]